eukprot:3670581-Lingulodinium_polyedra.AAC.1
MRLSAAKRAGAPQTRVMAMRWSLAWKKLDEPVSDTFGQTETQKAKARLVVKRLRRPRPSAHQG